MASTYISQIYNKSIILGTGVGKVTLSTGSVVALLNVIADDLGSVLEEPFNLDLPSDDYYMIPLEWFETVKIECSHDEVKSLVEVSFQEDNDFLLYFKNLCELHKRRVKYSWILSTQSLPTLEQIGPRSLLEFQLTQSSLLVNWMLWRKWIFDVDNRSGQETGYLFEPILASCLGGEPLSSTKSPVKRVDSDGKQKAGGRQVDCFVASDNVAYEFKLRVTIAASGQGRFAEELSFPYECNVAGIKPILLVLDATGSSRLTELSKAFSDNGGESFVGEDAWNYIAEHSGEKVTAFVNNYIKYPLEEIGDIDSTSLQELTLSMDGDDFKVVSVGEVYSIKRK
jgi:hypothetical protein